MPQLHAVLGTPLEGPWPEGTEVLYVAMGCFWGAERVFWQLPGVVTTAVGYQGGFTPNPTYEETCTGRTGHTETVLIAYDPKQITAEELLRTFWEIARPHAGLPAGQRRRHPVPLGGLLDDRRSSGVAYEATGPRTSRCSTSSSSATITTEARPADEAGTFYYAEDYHQQYLHKVPNGYCGLGGTGISCPVGVVRSSETEGSRGQAVFMTA